MWGDESELHVIPCDDRGSMLNPHTRTCFCVCHPAVAESNGNDDGRPIFSHNEVH